MECLLELRGVWKSYGRNTVLRGVNLCVPRGGVLGLVGPNGAGKSTVIKVGLGVLRRDRGRVRLRGLDPFRDSRAREGVGVVFERPVLPGGVPVFQVLRHAARIRGAPQSTVWEAIEMAGLRGHEWKPFEGLSAGLKQRAAIAHALVGDPELLVADEPTSNLDPVERLRILDLLSRLNKEKGLTILFSSHVLPEVVRVAGALAVVMGGRVVAQGPPEEVLGGLSKARVRASDPEALAELLSSKGIRVRVEGLSLLVDARGPRGQAILLEALSEAASRGIRVYSVDFVEAGLEAMLVEGSG